MTLRHWTAGKLIKIALSLLDKQTRYDVIYLLGKAADRDLL